MQKELQSNDIILFKYFFYNYKRVFKRKDKETQNIKRYKIYLVLLIKLL